MKKPNPWWAAAICAAAGAVVFQFFGNANHGYIDTNSLFWWWGFQWVDARSETQHGWLVLAIAVGLTVRALRAPIAECGVRTADCNPKSAIRNPQFVAPVTALLGGLALHAVGFAAQQARLSIIALLVFTWGVLRLGGGPRWGRALAFPLAFMVFAIPLNALDSVGFWLRLGVTNASAHIAHAAHIGVLQNGTQLVAPDGSYNYDVAGACSGIRSLMALAALSLLIGYLEFRSWWRRALMLGLCFPLVYVGNVARITSIVFAAQAGGPKWGDVAHAVMGWGVFVIVLGGVLAAASLLRRFVPEPQRHVGGVPSPRGVGGAASPRGGGTPPTFPFAVALAAFAVVVLCGTEMLYLHHLATRPERGEAGVALAADGRNPVDLPTFLGRDWVGYPVPVTAVEREILPPDTGYSRMEYVATRDNRHVFLSIVLSGRDRTSIHRPELCLVGQGWTIMGQATHVFTYPTGGHAPFTATVLQVRHLQATPRGPQLVPQIVAYWFINGDTVVATHWQRVALDAWNRIVHGRADRWAYVLMQTDATDGDAAAFARLQAVLDRTMPAFAPTAVRSGKADVLKR